MLYFAKVAKFLQIWIEEEVVDGGCWANVPTLSDMAHGRIRENSPYGGAWSVRPDWAIFESSWQHIFPSKVARIFGEFLGYLKNTFQVKIGQTRRLGYFLVEQLVTLSMELFSKGKPYPHNGQKLVIACEELLFLLFFTTSYHLGLYKPSSYPTKELHVRGESLNNISLMFDWFGFTSSWQQIFIQN